MGQGSISLMGMWEGMGVFKWMCMVIGMQQISRMRLGGRIRGRIRRGIGGREGGM